MLRDAITLVAEMQTASTSMLQRGCDWDTRARVA